MFLGTESATHDRILDFSTAVTGTLFYVPPADFLDDLPAPPALGGRTVPRPAQPPEPAATATAAATGDGSLSIGGLGRNTGSTASGDGPAGDGSTATGNGNQNRSTTP